METFPQRFYTSSCTYRITVILSIMSDILMKRLSYGRKARRHCNDCMVGCATGWWAVGPNMHTAAVTRTAQTPTELLLLL